MAMEYKHHAYDTVNDLLDTIALRLSNSLQRQGYRAFPIPASKRAVVDERVAAIFSHKLAAHMAGLGWIGKSCLLITPEAGPRVRWATVLTDAPIARNGLCNGRALRRMPGVRGNLPAGCVHRTALPGR